MKDKANKKNRKKQTKIGGSDKKVLQSPEITSNFLQELEKSERTLVILFTSAIITKTITQKSAPYSSQKTSSSFCNFYIDDCK